MHGRPYITLNIIFHYITLHYIRLHYIRLYYITLNYITIHYIATAVYLSDVWPPLHSPAWVQTPDFQGFKVVVKGGERG